MLSRLFGSRTPKERTFRAPAGTRIYVVGDIHGRADLLRAIHRQILDDVERTRPDRPVVVYLGDYIDRGEQTRQVLDILTGQPIDIAERVHLLGNHEEFMLTFLKDSTVGDLWLKNGGDATMFSYGVGFPKLPDRAERFRQMRDDLIATLPDSHLAFLQNLTLTHVEGDYVFVHAGIKPGCPIDDQVADDLLWIRGEFLESRADHGKCVVHGHTITDEVETRPNRIGIDTGAYFSGRLTCLVLDGDSRSVLHT